MSDIDKMRYEREKQLQMNGYNSMPPGMSEELQTAQHLQFGQF